MAGLPQMLAIVSLRHSLVKQDSSFFNQVGDARSVNTSKRAFAGPQTGRALVSHSQQFLFRPSGAHDK